VGELWLFPESTALEDVLSACSRVAGAWSFGQTQCCSALLGKKGFRALNEVMTHGENGCSVPHSCLLLCVSAPAEHVQRPSGAH